MQHIFIISIYTYYQIIAANYKRPQKRRVNFERKSSANLLQGDTYQFSVNTQTPDTQMDDRQQVTNSHEAQI